MPWARHYTRLAELPARTGWPAACAPPTSVPTVRAKGVPWRAPSAPSGPPSAAASRRAATAPPSLTLQGPPKSASACAAPPRPAAPAPPALGSPADATSSASAAGAASPAWAAACRDSAGGAAAGPGQPRELPRGVSGQAMRSTSCENVSRPRSAPNTVVACTPKRTHMHQACQEVLLSKVFVTKAGLLDAKLACLQTRINSHSHSACSHSKGEGAPAGSTSAPQLTACRTHPSAGPGSGRRSQHRLAGA